MQDSQDLFRGARCCRLDGACSPREAEAMRMKKALLWIILKRSHSCISETDSQVLVAACKESQREAIFDRIVGDCIELLMHIKPVLVKFVYHLRIV